MCAIYGFYVIIKNMKKILLIALGVIIIAVGAILYFKPGVAPSPVGQNTPATSVPAANQPIPVPNEPIPASSYGKDAVGSASGELVKPKPTEAVGILSGKAKLAAGATIQLTSVKVSIFDPVTNKTLETANLGSDGTYKFVVLPGEYVVNIVLGTGSSQQLPQRVYVGPNETIEANFLVK